MEAYEHVCVARPDHRRQRHHQRIGEHGWPSSAACEVTLLNRGTDSTRPPIDGAESLVGDAGDPASIRAAVGRASSTSSSNFRAFTPEQVAADIELFAGRTGQYVFISSASAYQKPVAQLPIVESTPLRNPFWQYSRDKIACEDLLVAAYRDERVPDDDRAPVAHLRRARSSRSTGGWTALDRMRDGEPVVVHGDGTSLVDAHPLPRLRPRLRRPVRQPARPRRAVHITSDEVAHLERDRTTARPRARRRARHRARRRASASRGELPSVGAGLLGDKAHSVVFDNTRVKTLVPGWAATTPFAEGAREIVEWYLADPARQASDAELDAAFDSLAQRFG